MCGQACLTCEAVVDHNRDTNDVKATFWEVDASHKAAAAPQVRELWSEESEAMWLLNETMALRVQPVKEDCLPMEIICTRILENLRNDVTDPNADTYTGEQRFLTRTHLLLRHGHTLQIHALPSLEYLHTVDFSPLIPHVEPLLFEPDLEWDLKHGVDVRVSDDGTVFFLGFGSGEEKFVRVVLDFVERGFWICGDGRGGGRDEEVTGVYGVVREKGVEGAGGVVGVRVGKPRGELRVYFRSREYL
ncbi:hypothetical protein HDV00_011719 [Rhizophlyctis rosea]|nr:hypothetical protein HDV00_011719 [Rhizophlyctis rosea]